MLTCLRVRHLAIIDQLEVELGPGLNVITGETGAGKSILIDALGLVLGERGRPELVRTGAKQAEVEALFEIGDDPETLARLEASGLEPESELVVRRVVSANGRTRAYLNGRLATAGQLGVVLKGLVDISSQHEHHTLVDPQSHLDYLDAYGRLEENRARMAAAYAGLAEAEAALAAARETVASRDAQEDLLRFQIHEIDELAPVPGEREALREERERLRHAATLLEAAGGAEAALYADDGSLTEHLGRVVAEVRAAGKLDPRLAALGERLESAAMQVEEVARDLGAYARDVSLDPERLAEVEERAHRLDRLLRKYGGDEEALLARREEAAAELEALDEGEARVEALEAARRAALERAAEEARALSAKRREVAEALGRGVGEELSSLGMGGARVEVQVAPLGERTGALSVDGARLSEQGIDRVELLIAPNRGEEVRPLRKVASGGELSRAMLAIKRVLAGLGRAGLYVFDEVDSGVGGAVAEVIGQKLADVAAHHQVICITHLAQIAVYGDRHYQVQKRLVGERTVSDIHRLDEAERLEEIARMVGGLKITRSTKAAAAELLKSARARV